MKDARIGKLRSWAEKDLRISHCARTLLFRIFSDRYLDPRNLATEPFELPWTTIAKWCGLTDQMNCYTRSGELVTAGYLFDEGVRGCPPTKLYKLNLKLALQPLIKDGVIRSSIRRQGNKDAARRKAEANLAETKRATIAAMRDAAR